jgi:hypothetical protein
MVEEFHTILAHPHQFRKTLIRVFRLKSLRWSLLRNYEDGRTVRLPELMQILDEDAEYIVRIEDQKRKRPNTLGSSKRKHFERVNQKRRRGDPTWSPPQDKSSQRTEPQSHGAKRSEAGHHEEGSSDRFTRTSDSKPDPHVEPPRSPGWKPLILVPPLIQL